MFLRLTLLDGRALSIRYDEIWAIETAPKNGAELWCKDLPKTREGQLRFNVQESHDQVVKKLETLLENRLGQDYS
jgi:hypothetical protein